MRWFYMGNAGELGPFDKDQMQGLVQKGDITEETLVRNDQNLGWTTYSSLLEMAANRSSAQQEQVAKEHASAGMTSGHKAGICSQCGDAYALEKLVTFRNRSVCPLCAPSLLQRVGEGAEEPLYAGFWIRFWAKLIDGLILLIPLAAFNIAIALMVPDMDFSGEFRGELTAATMAGLGLMYMMQVAIPLGYNTFFVGRYSATPGKMALGLRIILPGGDRISYPRALGRHFAEFLSQITLYAGYVMAGFDLEKRALHDHIAGTRVVRKQPLR